jgi:hypothetical protein
MERLGSLSVSVSRSVIALNEPWLKPLVAAAALPVLPAEPVGDHGLLLGAAAATIVDRPYCALLRAGYKLSVRKLPLIWFMRMT